MAQPDRARWNEKYERGAGSGEPSAVLLGLAEYLPTRGRALDIAGGAGGNALWLARRGLEVTLVDVSDVGLERARARARAEELWLDCVRADLECEALPSGPWALISCSHYLQRELIAQVGSRLEQGGRFVWIHPTQRNLERHARPSARFLLAPGEAGELVREAGLELELDSEGWTGAGDGARHLARVVARRV